MSQSRQLAAIMFTDIVGYTALMGSDEKKAFQLLKKNRQIHHPLIKRYNGTWIKELGDGVLASFQSVSGAVLCAAAIHNACSAVDGLKLRIGIHLGEVVFESNDVFGDGVNIAARLQALAPIGGTLVSESVYKNIINKIEIIAEFIREENLKNVSEPVKIYEVRVVKNTDYQGESFQDLKKETNIIRGSKKKIFFGIAAFLVLASVLSWYFLIYKKQAPASADNNALEKSIAVLPFVDMSPEKDLEYFGDGIAEAIINGLAQVNDLKVIARSSSFQFKGKNVNLRTVGEMLVVATVLEGSIKKSGNKIRVTATLTKTADGALLWSESFDRNLNDYLLIQDEITSNIVGALKITLSRGLQSMVRVSRNADANKLYQLGRYFHDRNGPGDMKIAKNYFSQAVEIDSGFALAWAYRAIVSGMTDSTLINCRLFNQKALDLDPNLADAHVNLAILYHSELNFVQVEKEFRTSLSLEGRNPRVLRTAGRHLSYLGRFQEGLELCKKAVSLDPLQSWSYLCLTHAYIANGQFSDALNAWERENEISKREGILTKAHLLILNRKIKEALEMVDKISEERDRLFLLALISYASNQNVKSDQYFKMFKDKYGSTSPLAVIEIQVFCGQKEEALRTIHNLVLTRLNQWRSPDDIIRDELYLKGSPYLIPVRDDPRFKECARKLNYPE